jgi:hypothetical protein
VFNVFFDQKHFLYTKDFFMPSKIRLNGLWNNLFFNSVFRCRFHSPTIAGFVALIFFSACHKRLHFPFALNVLKSAILSALFFSHQVPGFFRRFCIKDLWVLSTFPDPTGSSLLRILSYSNCPGRFLMYLKQLLFYFQAHLCY